MTRGLVITMKLISTGLIVTIIVTVVLIAILVALYFAGKKLQKKQAEQAEQMKEIEQTFPSSVSPFVASMFSAK